MVRLTGTAPAAWGGLASRCTSIDASTSISTACSHVSGATQSSASVNVPLPCWRWGNRRRSSLHIACT